MSITNFLGHDSAIVVVYFVMGLYWLNIDVICLKHVWNMYK
jgi:hypothetical protein